MSAELPELVSSPSLTALVIVELGLLLGGCVLLFRRRHDLLARLTGRSLVRLSPATFSFADLLLGVVFIIAGGLIAQTVAVRFARTWFPPAEDGTPGLFEVFAGAGLQLGLLAGLAITCLYLRLNRSATASASPASLPQLPVSNPPLSPALAVLSGARAFAALLPLIWLSSLLWKTLLDALGFDAPPQDLVLIFMRTGDQRALAAMILFAVVIAPLTEELLFRVGLFRWLRTRTHRAVALLLPSVVFSLLHFSWAALLPLAVLAVGISFAYERSGHPLTPVTTHALFNLNTILLLLVGFPS